MSALEWDLFGTSANTDTPDANGCIWTVASSDGWDAPDQRTKFESQTGRHGQYVSSQLADGRQVVVKGLVMAPTQEAAWLAYDQITSAMPGLTGVGDIVSYEPVPKRLTVVQAAPPRASKPLGGTLTYWLTLLAEYPWKRALAPVTVAVPASGSVPAVSGGTAAADLVVTLTTSGTVVLGAGGVTLTTATLPAGSVIDTAATSVTGPDGADLFHLVSLPPLWPALPAGGGSISQAGTASLSVEYFDTYA